MSEKFSCELSTSMIELLQSYVTPRSKQGVGAHPGSPIQPMADARGPSIGPSEMGVDRRHQGFGLCRCDAGARALRPTGVAVRLVVNVTIFRLLLFSDPEGSRSYDISVAART